MTIAIIAGTSAAAILLISIVWSIVMPHRRLWPPKTSTPASKTVVWVLTLTIFASALYVGVTDWNQLRWSPTLRWSLGLPLILLGNIVVWWGVAQIGFDATSGEATGLSTDGLYRYSRNPQYVADIAILVGWFILSATAWILPIAIAGVLALVMAPLAEEAWLEERYVAAYRSYRARVRRYV